MTVSIQTAAASKYLTFVLSGETYGLEIQRVAEIVGLLPVTRVPRLPDFVSGVINLRGRVIPVVDLRLAFGLDAADLGERTCIVITQVARGEVTQTIGLIVDQVSEVLDLPEEAIEPTPDFGTSVDLSFVKGVGRMDDLVVLLLDIDLALSANEIVAAERAVEYAGAVPVGAGPSEEAS